MNTEILNGSYGPHERNLFDFFPANSALPAPLVIYIHGGGFVMGEKEHIIPEEKEKCLQNKMSFASISYPYITQKPLPDVLKDIARAIQYFKYKADELQIDKNKISCYGSSAGAGASLFLTSETCFSNPTASDPILRETTHLFAAGLYDTQSTYDFSKWPSLLNLSFEELYAIQQDMDSPLSFIYGKPITSAEDFLNEDIAKIAEALDMTSHLVKGDSPLYIKSSVPKDVQNILHAQTFSQAIYDICVQRGIPAELYTPEMPSRHADFIDFVLSQLAS